MDLRNQCTYAKAKKRLYIRCVNSSQNLWCSKTSTTSSAVIDYKTADTKIKVSWATDNAKKSSKYRQHLMYRCETSIHKCKSKEEPVHLMWEFIPESVMVKNIYHLECRNRLKNPRYQNKSIKRNWQCYNDFQVLKTSIGWIWDINAQMQRQRKDCTLDVRIHPRTCDAQKHLPLRVP